MEPTGYHETVSGKLAAYIGMALLQNKQPWFIPRTCLISPFSEIATARRPDLIVFGRDFA
jgi:Uma2 family endonuclease